MAAFMPLRHSSRQLYYSTLLKLTANNNVQPVRYRWRIPDPDLIILPPFSQRLAEWKQHNEIPPASVGINIGLPFKSSVNADTSLSKLRQWSKSRLQKEVAARHQQLKLDFDEMRAEWNSESRPIHTCRIAKHYGIFNDMFDGAHFYPTVPLEVMFDYDEQFITPVCHGNVIQASETQVQPYVKFPSEEDGSLWTLVMSSPDGNLEENDRELLHWMVGNIPGSELEKGDVLCNYLQPFPVKGAGFLRYVLVLYKQSGPLDLSAYRRQDKCLSLRDRSFSTLEMYRAMEDDLTPAGLAFFQSQWDQSVRSVFHNVLDMPEPKFEFIHPPPYRPRQLDIPHREPFNIYMDRYRDVKEVQEEVLKYKLKDREPLSPPPPPLKYPNIDTVPRTTQSWLQCKIEDIQLGRGKWKALYEKPKE